MVNSILCNIQVSKQIESEENNLSKDNENDISTNSNRIKDGRARVSLPPRYEEVGISGLLLPVIILYFHRRLKAHFSIEFTKIFYNMH